MLSLPPPSSTAALYLRYGAGVSAGADVTFRLACSPFPPSPPPSLLPPSTCLAVFPECRATVEHHYLSCVSRICILVPCTPLLLARLQGRAASARARGGAGRIAAASKGRGASEHDGGLRPDSATADVGKVSCAGSSSVWHCMCVQLSQAGVPAHLAHSSPHPPPMAPASQRTVQHGVCAV